MADLWKYLSQPQLNLNLTSTSTVVVGFWQRWQCIPPHHTTQSQRQNSRTPDKHLLTTSKDNMIRNNNWNHNNNITNNNINNNIQTIITSCGWAIELGLIGTETVSLELGLINLVPQKIWFKKMLSQKMFIPKKFWSQTILVLKMLVPKKIKKNHTKPS